MFGKIEASAAYMIAVVYAAAGSATATLAVDNALDLDRVLPWAVAGALFGAAYTVRDALRSPHREPWPAILFDALLTGGGGFAVAMAGGGFAAQFYLTGTGAGELALDFGVLVSALVGEKLLDFVWRRAKRKDGGA